MRWIWIIAGVVVLLLGGTRLTLDVKELIAPSPPEVDDLGGLEGFVEATTSPAEEIPSVSLATLPPPPLTIDIHAYADLTKQEEKAISSSAGEAQTFYAPALPTAAGSTEQARPAAGNQMKYPPAQPLRLEIPAIALKAPVVPMKPRLLVGDKRSLELWKAPDEFAAGWMLGTARLGESGNTVLNGHQNIDGEVFRYLVDLQPGDVIKVYAADYAVRFEVTNIMILEEKNKPLADRMENARWIMPSGDERLTLVTCWPYDNNTHRLVVVAQPIEYLSLGRAAPDFQP